MNGPRVGLTAGLFFLLTQSPWLAQGPDPSQGYLTRALDHERDDQTPRPFTTSTAWCATTTRLVRAAQTGIRDVEPLGRGAAVRADQVPRFLSPTHKGEFGFDNFSVLGDHPSLTFERRDPWAGNGDRITTETWTRTGTSSVAGRLVSVFTPRWPVAVLHDTLRRSRWGVDRPYLFWGRVVVPLSRPETVFGQVAAAAEDDEKIAVVLNMRPTGLPASPITRLTDAVQFSSHAVNLWIPGFGDSRVTGGDQDLDLDRVTSAFYQHFQDAYEIIAVVSQTNQLPGYGGFHRLVRNDVSGIGLPLIDESARFGSAGVLEGVEFYPHNLWTTNAVMLHETGHQWGEYSSVWDPLGGVRIQTPSRAATLARRGHDPEVHTPLLSPGAVTYGAVLEAERRVGPSGGSTFVIERTMPLITFNPLTFYRMGHLSPADLPTYRVFLDQGQFDVDTSVAPEVGTAVTGGHVEVTVAQMIAADGVRDGPVTQEIRRAVVYVSRDGLASPAEMQAVNFFAARFSEADGVTSWDRYPGFFQATGGRATMSTAIHPRTVAPPRGPSVAHTSVSHDVLVGVRLDRAIPGRVAVGETMTIDGRLTLVHSSDYEAVCFRFHRYGATEDDRDEVFECSPLGGARFSVSVTFGPSQRGTYTVEPFAFRPDETAEWPLSWYGTMSVE